MIQWHNPTKFTTTKISRGLLSPALVECPMLPSYHCWQRWLTLWISGQTVHNNFFFSIIRWTWGVALTSWPQCQEAARYFLKLERVNISQMPIWQELVNSGWRVQRYTKICDLIEIMKRWNLFNCEGQAMEIVTGYMSRRFQRQTWQQAWPWTCRWGLM